MTGIDFYAVLGVAPDASPDEIRRAYRHRARSLHPDVAGPASEEEFKRVGHAYEVLSQPEERTRYDAWLACEVGAEAAAAPRWEIASRWSLAGLGVLWLHGIGAADNRGGHHLVMLGASYLFIYFGAPLAVLLVLRSNLRMGQDRAPRTIVMGLVLAVALVFAGGTVGGSVGEAIASWAGGVVLAFLLLCGIAVLTPLGAMLVAVLGRRRTR